jgi:long-chain-acyl-CoA dehydrogenase
VTKPAAPHRRGGDPGAMPDRTVDRCLQLHGGYGYMREYPVARAYLDSRVQTIYGGTTEIMKEIIGRSLGV